MSTTTLCSVKLQITQFAKRVPYSVVAMALVPLCASSVLAQDDHSHHGEMASSQQNQSAQQSELLRIVRDVTARFQDVRSAENAGYQLKFGCVSGPDSGAMGLHYVNDAIVGSGVLDVTRPQIVLYEAQPNGRLKLTGADYLLLAADWDSRHPGTPPELMGQFFHYFEAPNRFGLPAFYTLHVWAWKENPNGAFVNWHPDVSCQTFVGKTTP